MSLPLPASTTAFPTNRSPETDAAGTVTQWEPIPTAFASHESCANALLSDQFGNLNAYDPGYAITVDASIRCWPSEATQCKSMNPSA